MKNQKVENAKLDMIRYMAHGRKFHRVFTFSREELFHENGKDGHDFAATLEAYTRLVWDSKIQYVSNALDSKLRLNIAPETLAEMDIHV